jgi:hypothetical protein
MATIRKRKDLMWTEVAKNDQDSLGDRDRTRCPHQNADLWTNKVSHQKFLGVRIFWKSGPELKTTLVAVTSYVPPKVEEKTESEWLLEYVLVVLKWYGVEPMATRLYHGHVVWTDRARFWSRIGLLVQKVSQN